MQNTAMSWKQVAAINGVVGALFLMGFFYLQGLDELVIKGKGEPDHYRHFAGAPLELLRYSLALMSSAAALVVVRVVSTRRAYLGPGFAMLFAVLAGGAAYCFFTAVRS